jgi:hypothetical protein
MDEQASPGRFRGTAPRGFLRRFPDDRRTTLMRWLPKWFSQRRPRRLSAPCRFIPELTPLESRDVPTVLYYGGNVLPHVEAQALYYGSGWLGSPTASQFEAYLQYLVNSPYMDTLTNAGYGVGRGSWSQGIIYQANLPSGSNLLDSTIRSTIQSEIYSGSLRSPDANRLYVVFVQSDVIVTNDVNGGSSSRFEPNGFVGYHGAFAGYTYFGSPTTIHYALVVTPGGTYNGYSSTLPTFDQMTSIASHEVAEAVTDPDVNYAQVGWYDPQKGEIGDVFGNDDVFLNRYVVQIEAGKNDNPIVPATPTYTAAAFPGQGLWRKASDGGWVELTAANAEQVDADANGDVVAEFAGQGVWRYTDATGWQQLTAANASLLAMSGKGIVVAGFAGSGVWRYEDGRGWQLLTLANASQLGVDLYGNVVGEFAGDGVWRYDDFHGWQQLTGADASLVAIGDNGVVTGANASQLSVDAVGNVVGEYSGVGVWRYEDTQGWIQLTPVDAGGVAGGAIGDVIASFNGYGLWLYDDARGWLQITPANPALIAIGA